MAGIQARGSHGSIAQYRNVSIRASPLLQHVLTSSFSYKFALPRPTDVLGLPIGQHIQFSVNINGADVVRSYTPVSSDETDKGSFSMLIKSYPTGNISRHIAGMKLGQSIKTKGPKGQFVYHSGLVRAFGMIAGGTGLAPMLQIIKAIVRNPQDKTEVDLIFANVNEEDILLREELDELATRHNNLRVHYVLNNPPEGWKGGVGFVTQDMIKVGSPILYCLNRRSRASLY
jgi:cytochrome-b5 reductase